RHVVRVRHSSISSNSKSAAVHSCDSARHGGIVTIEQMASAFQRRHNFWSPTPKLKPPYCSIKFRLAALVPLDSSSSRSLVHLTFRGSGPYLSIPFMRVDLSTCVGLCDGATSDLMQP